MGPKGWSLSAWPAHNNSRCFASRYRKERVAAHVNVNGSCIVRRAVGIPNPVRDRHLRQVPGGGWGGEGGDTCLRTSNISIFFYAPPHAAKKVETLQPPSWSQVLRFVRARGRWLKITYTEFYTRPNESRSSTTVVISYSTVVYTQKNNACHRSPYIAHTTKASGGCPLRRSQQTATIFDTSFPGRNRLPQPQTHCFVRRSV